MSITFDEAIRALQWAKDNGIEHATVYFDGGVIKVIGTCMQVLEQVDEIDEIEEHQAEEDEEDAPSEIPIAERHRGCQCKKCIELRAMRNSANAFGRLAMAAPRRRCGPGGCKT